MTASGVDNSQADRLTTATIRLGNDLRAGYIDREEAVQRLIELGVGARYAYQVVDGWDV